MALTPSGRRRQRKRYQRAAALLQLRLEANRRRRASDRLEEKRVVISATDPEAGLGLDKLKTYRPLYVTMLMTDRHSPLILGYGVFAQSQDTALLVPTLEQTQKLTGRMPARVVADAGLVTGINLARLHALSVELVGPWKENDLSSKRRKPPKYYPKERFHWRAEENAYECPAGERLTLYSSEVRARAGDQQERLERYGASAAVCTSCPLRSACTQNRNGRTVRRSEHEDLINQHRERMTTPEAKSLVKQRGQVAELGFADLKEHRQLRRHTGRSLQHATTDVALAVLLHNILILLRHPTTMTASALSEMT